MISGGVAFTIQGSTAQIEVSLHRFLRAVTSGSRDFLDGIGAAAERQTSRRFQTEKESPDGVPWASWSPKYAASKHGEGGHEPHPGLLESAGKHSILVLDGHLQDSITHTVDGLEVSWGVTDIKGPTHQYGAKKGSYGSTGKGSPIPFGNIPARPFLGISADNQADFEEMAREWFEGMWR